jgi:tripartite ATP-independent transporter DctP family solute receptor
MVTRRTVLSALAGTAATLAAPGILRAQSPKTVRFGEIFPKAHPYYKGLARFSEEVEKKTNRAVKVETFSDGQLGGEVAMLQGMRTGTIDGGIIGAGTFALTTNQRKFFIMEMPYLFGSYEQYEKWVDSDVAEELRAGVAEKSGLRILAFGGAGFLHILNSKRPIVRPADLKGLKMRVWDSRSAQLSFELVGMTATTMPYAEVFSSLQQGVIDGLVSSVSTFHQTKVYEVAKYVSLSGQMYGCMPLVMSERVFQSFGKPEQAALLAAAKAATKYWRDLYPPDDVVSIKLLTEGGCKVNDVDHKAFRDSAQAGYGRFVELINEPGTKELIDRFKKFSA